MEYGIRHNQDFPVVGIGASDGLAQPSTDRKSAKSLGKSNKGKRTGSSSLQKGGKSPNLGTHVILPKLQPSRPESRPPMSMKRPTVTGVTRGDRITLLVFVLSSACCVDKWDIVRPSIPT